MPKIVHLAPYYAPHGGGVESHLIGLNKELIDRGYQVSVITTQHDPQLPRVEQLAAVTVYRLPVGEPPATLLNKFSYKLKVWTEIAKLWKIVHEADIIQVHDVYWWLLPLLPFIMPKTFIIFHGWEGVYPIPWQNKLQRWVWSKLAVRTIHVGTYLQHFYWDKPNRIVWGALDKRFVTTPIVPRKKSSIITITYIGRLVAENELAKYIALARELKKRNVKFELTWIGDGPYKNECAKVGKTPGFVSDVLSYLDQADLVWATSYLSTMQAQARGKVVCGLYSHPLKAATMTMFPTIKDMLVNESVSEMADLLTQLSENPELLTEYGLQARQWAITQTWQTVADEYEKLWGTYGR